MKRFVLLVAAVIVAVSSCASHFDDREFIRNMYEQRLFEDYTFLQKYCSSELLEWLSSSYDYEGEGYAVWEFRSGAQDGPSDEHAIKDIEEIGDGWYRYTASDMGIVFSKLIRIVHKGDNTIIDAISDNRN